MRGGKRPGAGRKTDRETARIRALLDKAITPARWVRVLRALAKKAEQGNDDCAALLMAYRFGKPATATEDVSAVPVRIVVYAGTDDGDAGALDGAPARGAAEGVS